MELYQRSSSCGSADCASYSPSSTDSPLFVTPEPSITTFSRQSVPRSLGGELSVDNHRRPTGTPAPTSCTQTLPDRTMVVPDIDLNVNLNETGDEAACTPPRASSRTRPTTAPPPRAQPVSTANEPTQIALSPSTQPCGGPLASSSQINMAALSDEAPEPAAAAGAAPGSSDSDDIDDVAVGADAASYPESTTPRKQRGNNPSFNNPLFVDSPCLSPWTQPITGTSPSLSGLSPPSLSSPTRRLFSLSAGRHHSYRRRGQLHHHHHCHPPPPHSPDGTAAALLAASSLLCRVALRGGGRSGRPGLEGSLAGYLRRQLEGFGDDVTPRARLDLNLGRRGLDQRLDNVRRSVDGDGEDGELDGVRDGGGSMSATLDLLSRNAALQRQLVLRTEENAALRLQLEEAAAARDEMALHYLESQEHIADLERRLAEEARARAALAVQSQLLQEQLQEACEAESEALQHSRQSPQALAAQGHVQQAPGRAPHDEAAATGAAAMSSEQPYEYDALYGSYLPRQQPTLGAVEGGGGGVTGGDPGDAEVVALRRENAFLTQRLIERSMVAAHAREQEEEARHKAYLMQELNQQYQEMVNTLSLELSLLRPNACGRARGVFSLPFLRRENSSASAT